MSIWGTFVQDIFKRFSFPRDKVHVRCTAGRCKSRYRELLYVIEKQIRLPIFHGCANFASNPGKFVDQHLFPGTSTKVALADSLLKLLSGAYQKKAMSLSPKLAQSFSSVNFSGLICDVVEGIQVGLDCESEGIEVPVGLGLT